MQEEHAKRHTHCNSTHQRSLVAPASVNCVRRPIVKRHTGLADDNIETGLSSDLHVDFGGRRCICIFKDQTTPPFP